MFLAFVAPVFMGCNSTEQDEELGGISQWQIKKEETENVPPRPRKRR